MTALPWWPVVWTDVLGSTAAIAIAARCVQRSHRWARARPGDVFRHYLFLLTLTIAAFAISRGVGHLVKQLLLATGQPEVWRALAPYSGATNSAALVAVFSFCLLFGRIRSVRLRVEASSLEAAAAAARADQAEQDQRRLATIFDALNAYVFVSDADHRVLYLNRRTRELLPEIREGSLACEILCDQSAPCDRCRCDRVLGDGESLVRELTLERADRVVQLAEIPVRWVDGAAVKLNVATDVTETRRLEMRLARAQKMEALGTLAGGVAHDLNNVLTGIVTYPELLLRDLPPGSPLVRPLQTIQASGERAAAIVQDLLTLSRRGAAATEPVDLGEVVREYLGSPEFALLREHHPAVRVETRLAEAGLAVQGSRVHLGKTVMNLVANAAEAMPHGGTVTVTTERLRAGAPADRRPELPAGEYAVLAVADTGRGIPAADRERIFEPFYTTKTMGRSGTGLGMTVVWGTVQDHGGAIDVESEVDKGSTFTLYFPASAAAAEAAAAPDLEHYRGRGEHILVVDDRPEQRDLAAAILGDLGYRVATADSGEAAVAWARRNPVDLAVLDMIMEPGIDGLETFRHLREVHPAVKAIIASGFSETDRVREAQRLGAGAYLSKPYTLLQLAAAVHGELGRR